MCACCGKYLAKTEELHLDSKKVDLHKACEKLLYVVENEKGRPMPVYSRTVTSLTGGDGSQNKSVTTDNQLSPETFYELDIGYKPCENEMLQGLRGFPTVSPIAVARLSAATLQHPFPIRIL